jgi:hypothetical protein
VLAGGWVLYQIESVSHLDLPSDVDTIVVMLVTAGLASVGKWLRDRGNPYGLGTAI